MVDTAKEVSALALGVVTEVKKMGRNCLLDLNQLHKMRLTLLEQELKGIQKTSEDTSLKTSVLIEKIENSKRAVNLINVQLEVEAIKVRRISSNQSLIHGRVTDEDYHGIKDLIVSINAGEKGRGMVSKTDKSGYYSIVLSTSVLEKRKDEAEMLVYVHYGDVLLHKSSIPLTLEENVTKYEIILSKNELSTMNEQTYPKDVRRFRKK
jgi:hypothetical protein